MTEQLLVLLLTLAGIFTLALALGVLIFLRAMGDWASDIRAQRRAKRARLARHESRYMERVTARNSRPAVVLHIDQRRAA